MGLVEQIKEVSDMVKELDNPALYGKVLELQAEALSLVSSVYEKDNRIRELEDHKKAGEQLMRDRGVYWDKGENGAAAGDPYCAYCWESARLAIHLTDRSCPHCKTLYTNLPSHY